MSAIAEPAQTTISPRVARPDLAVSAAVPVLYLFASAAVWLLLASFLALLCSLKLHQPALLAAEPYLTYGRVHAASDAALLYGFGVPAALGTGLWLLCRLGRTRLAEPAVATIGALLWNCAVAGGLWAIFRGAGAGFEGFEMPRGIAVVMLVSYLVIGVCGILTFHRRETESLYPSQWFVFGALFWFAWIFSTAALLLLVWPVRGVLQASLNWWYGHNLRTVFFGFSGLASIFYFIPKLIGRPLHSYYLAGFAFWTLALFGSWGGIPEGAPFPGWMGAMSVVGSVLTIVPILAVILNLAATARNSMPAMDASPCLRFTAAGLTFWLIASVQDLVGALPSVGTLTNFTWFTAAQRDLFMYGFFAMTMFGAMYYIVPRLAGPKSDAPDGLWQGNLIKWHFWLMLIGVIVAYLALVTAGVWQGVAFDNPANSFVAVMKSTLNAIRFSTLGLLGVVLGAIVFLLNFALLLKGVCCRCCRDQAAGQPAWKGGA